MSRGRSGRVASAARPKLGSDAGKVFLRASSSAFSWRLRLSRVVIVLMSSAFRLGNHFDFSDRAPEDLRLSKITNLAVHTFPRFMDSRNRQSGRASQEPNGPHICKGAMKL